MHDGARRLGLLALSVVLTGAVFSAPYVGTHDGPNHFVGCVLSQRLAQPDSPLQAYLTPGAPLTTQGFQTVCRAAVSVLDPFTAYSVSLAVLGLVYALGFAALARALDPRTPVWPLGFAAAFPWVFYMGFFSFHLGMGLGLWALALAVRWRPETTSWGRLAGLAGLLLFQAYSHPFAAAMTGGTLALIWLARAPADARLRVLGRTLAVGGPALVLFGGVLWSFLGPQPYQGLESLEQLSVLHDRRPLVDLAETFLGGHPVRAVAALVVVVGCAGLAMARWRALEPVPRVLLGLGVVGLVGALVAPFHMTSWSFFSPRLSALWPVLVPLVVPWPARARRAVTVGAFGLALGSLGWSAAYHRDVYAAIEPDLAALDADVTRTKGRLPLFLETVETDVAHVDPTLMLGHLYVIAQGGIDPFVWAHALTLDPIAFRQRPEKLFGVLPSPYPKVELALAGTKAPPRQTQLEFLAFAGRRFEDVILATDDRDAVDVFGARGYRPEVETGRVHLLAFEGCPLEIAFSGPASLPQVLLVQLGIPGLARPAEQTVEPPGTQWANGRWTLRWDKAPCGDVWLTVQVGYDVPVPEMLACQEFGGRRRVGLTLTHERGKLRCTLGPARE